jgi:arabinogalactan oligomer/maltooligosaccharide transport system substrate-binding protein
MKKILAILLAGMLTATAFAGCGGSSSKSEESSSAPKTSDTSTKDDSKTDDSKKDESSKDESKSDTPITTDMDADWAPEDLFGDENNISLKVWAPEKAVSLVKQQCDAFTAHYTNHKISIEVVAQGESDAATMIVNDPKDSADVFGFPSDQFNRLMDAQVLAPVMPDMADAIKATNAEKTVSSATFEFQGYEDLYAFPETNDNGYYLVYDKRVVTDDDAKTLEGVLAACKKAGKTFVMDAGNGYYACVFAFTGGVTIDGFEDDGETQKFNDYDEDTAVNTLMAFAKLMKDYKGVFVSQDPANISTGFKNGKVGAGIDGTWNSQPDKESLGDKFGAAKLPTVKVGDTDKQIISLFGYKYIGVNSHTKFQRSSQILAYYLAGQDCQEQRAKEIGWGPSNIEAQKAVSDDPILKAVSEQSENAVPQVNIAGTFWTSFGTLGSEMYKDGWKPDDRDATKALWEKTVKNVRDE